MAKGSGLVFTIIKNVLLLLSVLMVFGSIYVGSASNKMISAHQLQTMEVFGYLRVNVTCAEEKDNFNAYNCYNLSTLRWSFWWFLTVVTLSIQDLTAFVGVIGVYRESYELTIAYTAITAGVLLLNLINPTLLYTIVGPIFNALVIILGFVFSRYLKKIQYNLARAKSKKTPV